MLQWIWRLIMSHLKYFNYDDGGKFDTYQKDALWYSQGVRIDNKIELSGQGECGSARL